MSKASFLIRQIARAADGREIVRPRLVTAEVLTVGRAPDCDIHLPDLAAGLLHARISAIGARALIVEATDGLPFDIDGRQTKRAEIDAGTNPTIRIGAHRIAISHDRDEAGVERIILSVERVGALSETAGARNADRAFALAGVLPGKRGLAWGLIAAVLLLFLAWPVQSYLSSRGIADRGTGFHGDASWSPGALSQAHAGLEKNCQACHVDAFVAVRDEACVACHTTVHDHADPRRLALAKGALPLASRVKQAVARIFNAPPGRCVECHVEHQGKAPMAPASQRFCADCHGDLEDALHETALSNASDFGSDHPEFRPTVHVAPDVYQRISLDAAPKEDNALKFSHALHLSRTGGVARMAQTMAGEHGFGDSLACKDCHVAEPGGRGFKPVRMEASCEMCHALAFDKSGGVTRTLRHGDAAQAAAELRDFYALHRTPAPLGASGIPRRRPGDPLSPADFVRAPAGNARAVATLFGDKGVCAECHVVQSGGTPGTGGFDVVPVVLPQSYLPKAKFDHEAHKTEPCESCHAAARSVDARDVLLPKIESCQRCHGGEASTKKVASGCVMCHDYHSASGPLPAARLAWRGPGSAVR